MKITPLEIEGVWVAESPIWSDDRGFFREWFKSEDIKTATGRDFGIEQANISLSSAPYITKCNSCFKLSMEVNQAYKNLFYRKCEECECNEILPTASSYVKRCAECNDIRKENSRECLKCSKARIPPSQKEWDKYCYPCKIENGKVECHNR